MKVQQWTWWGGVVVGMMILGVLVRVMSPISTSRDEVIMALRAVRYPFLNVNGGGMRFTNILTERRSGDALGQPQPPEVIVLERFSMNSLRHGGIDIHGHIVAYSSEAKAENHYQRKQATPTFKANPPLLIGEQATVANKSRLNAQLIGRHYLLQRCHLVLDDYPYLWGT